MRRFNHIRSIFNRNHLPFETFGALKNILAEHYALGKLVKVRKIDKGYVNVSYEIRMFRDGKTHRYLLRCYRKGVRHEKIRFEHALLKQLVRKRFVFSPRVIETTSGKTYVEWRKKKKGGKHQEYYLALFNFLRGEDKYSWDNPVCTAEELADAARVLALYHSTVFGWQAKERWEKPVFVEYMPAMRAGWNRYSQEAEHSIFDRYFLRRVDYLSTFLKGLRASMGSGTYSVLPHVAIHGDYHPGNLKYKDEKVIGMFDFDWAKMDTRCFDVSLAVNYFCSSWEGSQDGHLLLDRVETFLDAYQETAQARGGLGALNDLELQCFPEMMMMSNFSIIDWTVKDFYKAKPDPDEYETYLRHNVRLLQWLERNRDMLAGSIQTYRQ